MRKIVRNKKKMVLGVVTIFLISATSVCATNVISSREVSYDNTNSKLEASNVQDALDQVYEKVRNINNKPRILAYTYNEDKNANNYCVTGDENTCKKNTCYIDKSVGSCPIGTVIKYMVNDWTQKVFYVLHDDGETITMQQRENTVRNVEWYLEDDVTKGPLTILPILEAATSTWTNVNFQTYVMGTTNFNGTNAYTNCVGNGAAGVNCTQNSYTLPERRARARMITAQEIVATGCKVTYEVASCPIYMYNYLFESTRFGGTIDDNETDASGRKINAYWAMTSLESKYIYHVQRTGVLGYNPPTTLNYGAARAVIVISK